MKCKKCGSKAELIRPMKSIPFYAEKVCTNPDCETNKQKVEE